MFLLTSSIVKVLPDKGVWQRVTPSALLRTHLIYGSFHGGVGCGSGEARSVSDTKFQKAMSCHIGVSRNGQKVVRKVQNRCFLLEKCCFSGISRVLRGVLTDIH